MQLNQSPRLLETVVLLTANLLNSSATLAADVSNNRLYEPNEDINFYDGPAPVEEQLSVDVAVVNYEEGDHRVKAVEPMVAVKYVNSEGTAFTAKYTYDTLTGATPNGAAPSARTQNFIVSSVPASQAVTTTSSSGRSITRSINGNSIVAYEAQPGDLPLAYGFKDERHSLDIGFSSDLFENTRIALGATLSRETDYATNAVRASVIQSFNNELTTLSLGINFEANTSKPKNGIPQAFSRMDGSAGSYDSLDKDNLSINIGVGQVMTRDWLFSMNYNYGDVSGYQSDPYRVVSLLHSWEGFPWTGYAMEYLFENRPDTRTRHSLYAGNKIAFDSYVLDLSGRLYTDDWGINSQTIEASLHIPLWSSMYIEPLARIYHQSAADFFTYYLPASETLPEFASADSRLDSFNAVTLGLRAGMAISNDVEAYMMAEYYHQQKAGAQGVLPGISASYDPFAGTDAAVAMIGVKYSF
jgi:hypothetical protein